MKKVFFCLMVSLLMPSMALAVSNSANENGNGSSGSNTVNSSTVTSQGNSTATDTASTNAGSQTQSENRIQTQTSNPGVGTMTQEQTEAKIQEQITESKPEYSPRNEKATERMSKVAVAAEQLIRVSNRIENQGIGDQIREAAQTQTKNQDKINQSIDKTETRTGFAKFFIGPNYKELKQAKALVIENQTKIQQLTELMSQVSADADKLEIANQIIAFQQESLSLDEQLEQLDNGFSLFGWIARIRNNYK